jgi:hypothetical protein
MSSRGPAKNPKQFSTKWQHALVKRRKRQRVKGQLMELYREMKDGADYFWSNRMKAERIKGQS